CARNYSYDGAMDYW
nr:immunoglobulin heavy chain junction region [Mus musculus]